MTETNINTQETLHVAELNPAAEKTVLLVGGITEGVKTLEPLAHALAGQDLRVLSFDPVSGPVSKEEAEPFRHHRAKSRQVSDIVSQRQRDPEDRFTLMGHSQGAVFALDAALENADKVERVILTNPQGLFADAFPRLAGRFALETVRKTVTLKKHAQRQQIEGIKRTAHEPRDFMGDAIDISRGSIKEKLAQLKQKNIPVDILLSAKDQVFPWRLQEDYFEGQSTDEFDFNSVSSYYGMKPSGKPHKLAGKWAGHDNPVIYPEHAAKVVASLIEQK